MEGCAKVSPGCDHCWSEAETLMRTNHPNENIRRRARAVVMECSANGSIADGTACGWQQVTGFDGKNLLREDNLDLPLRTKKPTVWAVWNDLFHDDVPDDFRDRAYVGMALCWRHTFLVLTKRSRRMADYWRSWRDEGGVSDRIVDLAVEQHHRLPPAQRRGVSGALSHVWHGVTTEDQRRADERVPDLLAVPGHRFISIDPMLGRITISPWATSIHAVLLGGESGSKARPMSPDWVRLVRDQCFYAGVPFFFKQWGSRPHVSAFESVPLVNANMSLPKKGRMLDGRTYDALPWDK